MIGTLSCSFLLTPAGKLFDRIGARWMGFGSCLALGIVVILLGNSVRIAAVVCRLIPGPYTVFVLFSFLFFLLRLSGQGILTMASRNMIMKWFDRHRGLVSGITGAAMAYGFSYAPTLFNRIIGVRGWSGTWILMGVLLIVLFAPLLLIFFRDNPEASGLVPDGREIPEKDRANPEIHHIFTLAEARRTIAFWMFSLTIAIQALVLTAFTFNVESIFEQAGMDGARGFALFPPAALVSVGVTLLGGWLSDRMQLRWLLMAMLIAMAIYMTGLIFLQPGWVVWLVVANLGFSNGLFGILMSVTWPRYYGREHLGAISGLCMALMVVFSAVGPAFFSAVHKYTGNYNMALLASLLATGLLLAGSILARNPQRRITALIGDKQT
jgi:cyanate permease